MSHKPTGVTSQTAPTQRTGVAMAFVPGATHVRSTGEKVSGGSHGLGLVASAPGDVRPLPFPLRGSFIRTFKKKNAS